MYSKNVLSWRHHNIRSIEVAAVIVNKTVAVKAFKAAAVPMLSSKKGFFRKDSFKS